MTVSRYLSGKARVSEKTGKRIQEAVDSLGYRPSLLARELSRGRTDLIVYVVPDILDPYFSGVCKGAEDICFRNGFNMMICSAEEREHLNDILDMVVDRKCAGALFHHLDLSRTQVDQLEEQGVRTMLIDNETETDSYSLDNDNYHGAYLAADFLLNRGCRRISMIRGLRTEEPEKPGSGHYAESYQKKIWEERCAGFKDRLKEEGIPLFSLYSARGSASMQVCFTEGQRVAAEILRERELPEAVYCASDLLALGVLGELLERKISVPEQIALIGHDGLGFSRFLYPRITTVNQPQIELGERAAGRLISRIRGEKVQKREVLASSIFIGDTVGTIG